MAAHPKFDRKYARLTKSSYRLRAAFGTKAPSTFKNVVNEAFTITTSSHPAAGRSDIEDFKEPSSDPACQDGIRHESGRESAEAVDFGFLAAQTFGDTELERELLGLFVAQAHKILPTLPAIPASRQGDAAHLLKGSARGIGAFAAADAADAYEQASAAERPLAYAALSAAFAAAEAAILRRLAGTAA